MEHEKQCKKILGNSVDFSANYIMWQDVKLLLLLLIVPKNLMDYVMSAMHNCILPESPIYSVDIIVLFFCFTALFLN